MKQQLLLLSILLALFAFGCDSQSVTPDTEAGHHATAHEDASATGLAKHGPPLTATVQVGRPNVGTDFFPPGSHDASFHAQDAFQPGTVVISAGGTVTFNLAMFHTVAIYEPGTSPKDIDTSLLEDAGLQFEFPPVINDPNGRLARTPVTFPAPTTFAYTFDEPGRYLVLCEVLPHFVEAKMYGWVIVK